MKKQAINFSWPATLSFSAENTNEHERFSRGKLAVFYQGETADHRYFSESLSKKLIASLPYTPIVSHYDEEKDDFVGHATQQDIYGIVDPCGEITFKQGEDGNIWCICDTVYYTERPDKVGEIAKKIAGHSQSLELDPNTVKYQINYDERRHFKNIEFTAGDFIGVSVLGTDQTPAFTGSSFFSCEDFDAKMKILRDYCKSQYDQKNGGNTMNFQEFMKLSWGDISIKVAEAINSEYQEEAYTYVVDMFDDSAIVRFYSYIDGSCKLMRVRYSYDENGVITLGTVNEVHIVYEDIQATTDTTGVEQATLMDNTNTNTTDVTDDVNNIELANDVTDSLIQTDVINTTVDNNSSIDLNTPNNADNNSFNQSNNDVVVTSDISDATQVTNAEVTDNNKKVSVGDEQEQEENPSTTSFTESERAEFETLKREKKVNLLDSYKEYLTDEEYDSYKINIDTFEVDTLEVELLKKYKNYSESTPRSTMRAFALSSPKTDNAKPTFDDIVRKYLSR